MDNNWISVETMTPPRNVVVETKIDDEKGERNMADLKLLSAGHLWFHPDGSMYVYYQPTHWRKK